MLFIFYYTHKWLPKTDANGDMQLWASKERGVMFFHPDHLDKIESAANKCGYELVKMTPEQWEIFLDLIVGTRGTYSHSNQRV